MNIFKYFKRMVSYLEDPRIPFLYPVLLFLAAVTLRNFLEIFSTKASISFKLFYPQEMLYYFAWLSLAISIIHFTVFWVALAMMIGIIFFLITKEDIKNIFRSLLPFFFILSITPIVDLIIGGGKAMNIAYLKPKTLAEFLPIPQGLTPGMVCTTSTGLALAFLYCKVKTNSWVKGLLGSLALYALLMVLSLLPSILRANHPLPIIRALLVLILILAGLIFYWVNKKYFIALARDTRWMRLFYFLLMFILGMLLAKKPFPVAFLSDPSAFILTLICIALSWMVSVMFNNLEDCSIDKVSNAHRPLVSGDIPASSYQKIALALILLAASFGAAVNFQTLFFCLFLMGNSFFYSLPPLRLKRIPLFSKLFISFNSLVLIMLGYIFSGEELLKFPAILAWYLLVFVTLALNFIDLKDYEGDKAGGILTIAVLFGLKKAKLIVGGFTLISYSILPWVMLDLRIFTPALILGALQFLLINKKDYQEKWVLITHLASIGILMLYLALSVRFI